MKAEITNKQKDFEPLKIENMTKVTILGQEPKEEKKLKPIPKISQKKKERIKKEWSEADLFREIWETREHICEICWKFIPEPRPECFSHVLSKGRYPGLRYNKRNIKILCSIDCHHESDRQNAWNDIELIKKILW